MEEKAIEYLDDTIDLTQYIAVIWKRRKFIIALCIISVLVTYVTSKLSPKVYKAQVLLMVTKPIYKISIEPKIQTDTYREASLETWRQLLKSRDIEEEVVSRLKGKGFTNDIDPARLEDMMEIEAIRSTNLLALKIKDSNSKRAAAIANIWAAVFVENNELFNKKETTQTLKVVKVQHETTKKQLTVIR